MTTIQASQPLPTDSQPTDLLEPHIGCIAGAMEIIGNKWTALLLRDLASGPKRFGELEKSLQGGRAATAISPRTLSQRLDDLESHGVITRAVFHEVPPRCEYALTDKGEDLIPILKQMAVWGEKYYEEPSSS
jgi:DNA-binding HxlR family transcriptional regulator